MSYKEVRLVLELIYEEHLHAVEPSMNTISKFKQREHTQANKPGMILISEEPRTEIISRFKTQQGISATHTLERRGQASSAGLKHSKAQQPLTDWRAEDRHHQQASNTERHSSHSQTGEQRTGIISRPETQQGMAATH